MEATKYPILDYQSDPVIDSPFRVRLHSGVTTPLLVAVASTKGCVGCFARNPDQSEGTCSQLPICDDKSRADDEDCIFILFSGVTNNDI